MHNRIASPAEHAARRGAVDEINRLFPGLPETEFTNLLMVCTPYPATGLAESLPALRAIAARASGSWQEALRLADEDFHTEMANLNPRQPLGPNWKSA